MLIGGESMMKSTHIVLTGLFVCTTIAPRLQAVSAGSFRLDDKDVKLTGCLVKGESGDHGYLITNLPGEPASTSSAGVNVVPGAAGTTGAYSTIFYWLDDDDDLKAHVGHRVEIEGHLKGDLKPGEIKLERKDNWTEVTVKSDGRSMKAKVPNASMFPASTREEDSKRKITALVRRVDVEHVRMVAARCE
jgi:hypothetical protein